MPRTKNRMSMFVINPDEDTGKYTGRETMNDDAFHSFEYINVLKI